MEAAFTTKMTKTTTISLLSSSICESSLIYESADRANSGKYASLLTMIFLPVIIFCTKGIMVPSSAVSPVLNGQQIWLIKNGKAHPEIVELGIRTSDQVQIIGNISSGDTLVTTGILSMRKGLDLKGKIKTGE